MIYKSTAGALKRSVFLCVVVLLAGCPANRQPEAHSHNGRETAHTASGQYPQEALDYITEALRHPTEGYPALAYTWTVVAQLDKLPDSKHGAAIRAEIADDVEEFKGKPTSELVAAWLNCAPELATQFIKDHAANGDWSYVDALWFHPEEARSLLADKATRIIPDTGVSIELAQRWLAMQQYWCYVDKRDGDLLSIISNLENDPRESLRASGWLLRLKPDEPGYIDYLKLGLKKAGPGKYAPLMGATEGIKISRCGKLAEILVPIAKSVILTDTKISKGMEKLKELKEANAQQLYTSYALTYLPGEQARKLRRILLKAKDPRVVWYSRLGELLHGEPKYWDEAIDKEGFGGTDWWLALETLDSPEPALLPTLKKMAASEDVSVRLRALSKLNTFRQYAEDPVVRDLILGLTQAKESEVQTAAWYCAGKVGVGDPEKVFADKKAVPEVRLAAAYAWLMEAQDGPPELRGVTLESISKTETTGDLTKGEEPSSPLNLEGDGRPVMPETKEGGK
jgi:hypothetical protein